MNLHLYVLSKKVKIFQNISGQRRISCKIIKSIGREAAAEGEEHAWRMINLGNVSCPHRKRIRKFN